MSFKHKCKYFLTIVLDLVYILCQMYLVIVFCWVRKKKAWHWLHSYWPQRRAWSIPNGGYEGAGWYIILPPPGKLLWDTVFPMPLQEMGCVGEQPGMVSNKTTTKFIIHHFVFYFSFLCLIFFFPYSSFLGIIFLMKLSM